MLVKKIETTVMSLIVFVRNIINTFLNFHFQKGEELKGSKHLKECKHFVRHFFRNNFPLSFLLLTNLVRRTPHHTQCVRCIKKNFATETQLVVISAFQFFLCVLYVQICLVGHHILQEFREGQVINLISNDSQRMELLPVWFFDIIISIFYIPIVFYLFLTLFHLEAITGGLFLLGLAAFFLLASYLVGKLRRQTARISDKRTAIMNELVSGVRAVKTQAWEDNYEESVKEIRR